MASNVEKDPVREYENVLNTEGPAGLQFLNARVPHRYSAVYRLDKGVLHNLYVFDKQAEVVPEFLEAVPLQDSFCQFVLREGLFRTVGTAQDTRLDGHKYQGAIGSTMACPSRTTLASSLAPSATSTPNPCPWPTRSSTCSGRPRRYCPGTSTRPLSGWPDQMQVTPAPATFQS